MGTRATIHFKDRDEEYFVYRGHDGYPENILPDLKFLIDASKGRWSGRELGTLVTLFLAINYDPDTERLPDYEMTHCFHGDESYRYYVRWTGNSLEYGVNK